MKRPLIIQPVVAANGACWRRQAVSIAHGQAYGAQAPLGRRHDTDTPSSGTRRTPTQHKSINPRRPS